MFLERKLLAQPYVITLSSVKSEPRNLSEQKPAVTKYKLDNQFQL